MSFFFVLTIIIEEEIKQYQAQIFAIKKNKLSEYSWFRAEICEISISKIYYWYISFWSLMMNHVLNKNKLCRYSLFWKKKTLVLSMRFYKQNSDISKKKNIIFLHSEWDRCEFVLMPLELLSGYPTLQKPQILYTKVQ